MNRVGLIHVGTADIGIGAAANTGVQGQVVVFHNGLPAGDPRQDALAATAEAGHEVVHHTAGEDDLVARQSTLVQPYRGTPGGSSYIGEVVLVGAHVIHQLDPVINLTGHQAHVLLRRLAAVSAGGGDNQHVLIPDAGGLQLRDQNGNIGLRRLPAAGDVGDDDTHLVPGFHQLLQRRGVDGMIQGIADVLRRRPLGQIQPIGLQLRRNQLRGQMNLKFLRSAFHRFCHMEDHVPFQIPRFARQNFLPIV